MENQAVALEAMERWCRMIARQMPRHAKWAIVVIPDGRPEIEPIILSNTESHTEAQRLFSAGAAKISGLKQHDLGSLESLDRE